MAVKKLLRCLYWLVAKVPWGLWSGCWGVACCVLGYGLFWELVCGCVGAVLPVAWLVSGGLYLFSFLTGL